MTPSGGGGLVCIWIASGDTACGACARPLKREPCRVRARACRALDRVCCDNVHRHRVAAPAGRASSSNDTTRRFDGRAESPARPRHSVHGTHGRRTHAHAPTYALSHARRRHNAHTAAAPPSSLPSSRSSRTHTLTGRRRRRCFGITLSPTLADYHRRRRRRRIRRFSS